MYEEFFKLSGPPFRLAPDPRYFFGSASHNKAMAYLHYGLRQAEGFIVITGDIGAGKSMLISHLIDQLDRSSVAAAHLLTPNVEPEALLAHILSAFRIEAAGEGRAAELEAFEDFLFDQMNSGRRVLLVVDEAQNLPVKTLEELRVLSNMDYEGTPLFQVFLVGQPDFRDVIAGDGMEQLRQRIIASYHLEPLSAAETEEYIRHRLGVSGWSDDPAITADAFEAIFAASGGVPRKINTLSSRVLLHAATEEIHGVNAAIVDAVASDLESESPRPEVKQEAAAHETSVQQMPAPQPLAEPGKKAAPSPAPVANTGGESMMQNEDTPEEELSVFDRLRATRARVKQAAHDKTGQEAPARSPATLDDVAEAIKAINHGERAALPANDEPIASATNGDDPAADLPPVVVDPKGWKTSVVATINDTRDELKRAHQSLARLRRELTDLDRQRTDRREKIVASLYRAENLLTEIRDARR